MNQIQLFPKDNGVWTTSRAAEIT